MSGGSSAGRCKLGRSPRKSLLYQLEQNSYTTHRPTAAGRHHSLLFSLYPWSTPIKKKYAVASYGKCEIRTETLAHAWYTDLTIG
jgi:hypothetical protein